MQTKWTGDARLTFANGSTFRSERGFLLGFHWAVLGPLKLAQAPAETLMRLGCYLLQVLAHPALPVAC